MNSLGDGKVGVCSLCVFLNWIYWFFIMLLLNIDSRVISSKYEKCFIIAVSSKIRIFLSFFFFFAGRCDIWWFQNDVFSVEDNKMFAAEQKNVEYFEKSSTSQSTIYYEFIRSITKIVWKPIDFLYARNVQTACCSMTAAEKKKERMWLWEKKTSLNTLSVSVNGENGISISSLKCVRALFYALVVLQWWNSLEVR